MDSSDIFFGHYIDPITIGGKALVMLLAVLLGGLIGFERQYHGNAAGMRTHILVCVGSAVITLASVEIGLGVRGGMRGDPGHIAAQIVSGVGFLGAGAILREGATVHGLTTAASVWATAGIGIALGASPRLGELAVVAAVVVLATLSLLNRLEAVLRIQNRACVLAVEVRESDNGPAGILALIADQRATVIGVSSEPGKSALAGNALGATRLMHIHVQLPAFFDRNKLNEILLTHPGVISFRFE